MSRPNILRTVIGSCALALLFTACGGSPEEKVARLRGMYKATLNGFLVQQPPAPEPVVEEGVGGEEGAVASGSGETPADEAAEPMAPEPPANPNIMLDILIQHDSPEILPGITVDVSMVDGAKNEKASWRVWFDTSTVKKANVTQYTHVLEDVPYEEGYGFSAEIRHPVPAAERGEYREFSAAG